MSVTNDEENAHQQFLEDLQKQNDDVNNGGVAEHGEEFNFLSLFEEENNPIDSSFLSDFNDGMMMNALLGHNNNDEINLASPLISQDIIGNINDLDHHLNDFNNLFVDDSFLKVVGEGNHQDESNGIMQFPIQLSLPTGMTVICNNFEEYQLFKTISREQETGNFIPIMQNTRTSPSVLKRMEDRRKEISSRSKNSNQSNSNLNGGISKPQKMKKKVDRRMGATIQFEKNFFEFQ